MKQVRGSAVIKILVAVIGVSLMPAGIAHAQLDIPVFTAKFTLTNQAQWDKTVLQPGDYTITIGSLGTPTAVLVRDGRGRPVARFVSGIDDEKASARNALFLRETDGQLRVYALALASLGRVLVFDPILARKAVLEAGAPQTVPVMSAKR